MTLITYAVTQAELDAIWEQAYKTGLQYGKHGAEVEADRAFMQHTYRRQHVQSAIDSAQRRAEPATKGDTNA